MVAPLLCFLLKVKCLEAYLARFSFALSILLLLVLCSKAKMIRSPSSPYLSNAGELAWEWEVEFYVSIYAQCEKVPVAVLNQMQRVLMF